MNKMLYDMRKDAIEKSVDINEENRDLLMDAIACLIYYAESVHRNGIPILHEIPEIKQSQYLTMLAQLVADGTEPELVMEFGSNAYWVENPQGASALVHYIYLRGILFIQEGVNLDIIAKSFQTLLPVKWHLAYYNRFNRILDSAWCNQKVKDIFSRIHPVFENTELLEKISALEMKIQKSDDSSVEDMLRGTAYAALIKCLYGFGQETRKRITDNLPEEVCYIVMAESAYLAETGVTETEILETMTEIEHAVNEL